jgi:hypothetical protein
MLHAYMLYSIFNFLLVKYIYLTFIFLARHKK